MKHAPRNGEGPEDERTPVTGTHGLLRSMAEINGQLYAALQEFRSIRNEMSRLRGAWVVLVVMLLLQVCAQLAYVLSHP